MLNEVLAKFGMEAMFATQEHERRKRSFALSEQIKYGFPVVQLINTAGFAVGKSLRKEQFKQTKSDCCIQADNQQSCLVQINS